MATVVSHAMRRIATTPDANYSSCGIRSEKSRLSWNHDSSESALSRSMRYADPWLYDGVRGGSGLLLAPALVLCSCQDYLNGTKRSSKNKKGPSTCKKCKGTRLPLSNGDSKFGTMRCYPTATLAQTPIRAGTVRVTSSSRPSILPTTDPYDLMRRSRLTVGDNGGSQFRARSVSPKKVRTNESRSSSASRQKPSVTKYSTVGRRSILECNVNPYELMSAESKETKESAITLLNGQRIRVRPQISDYEDIERLSKTKTSRARPSSTSSSTSSSVCQSPKSSDKDSECGRFKSILKKPSTSYSDTESGYEVSSPSPLQQRSGSHFYLPMPTPVNGPRKKVQFLVESERVSFETNGDGPAAAIDDEDEEGMQGYQVGSHEDVSNPTSYDSGQTKKLCKLKRSESDRALKEDNNKVIFHDSMALRAHNYRTDSRIVFTDKDLEKLDGIYTSRFGKSRPTEPPPEPPKTKQLNQIHTAQINEIEYYEDLDEDRNSSRKSSSNSSYEYYEDVSEQTPRKSEVLKEELVKGVKKLQFEEVSKSPKKKKVTYEDLEDKPLKKVGYEDLEDNLKKKVAYKEPSKQVTYEDLDTEKKQVNYEDLEDEPRKQATNKDSKETPKKKVSYEDLKDFPKKKANYDSSEDKPRKKVSYEDLEGFPKKKVSYDDSEDEPRKKNINDSPKKKVSYEDLQYFPKNKVSSDDSKDTPRKKVSYDGVKDSPKKKVSYEDLEANPKKINGYAKKTVHYEDVDDNSNSSEINESTKNQEIEKNEFIISSKIIPEEKPPSAPPRKRSSNKQPHNHTKAKYVTNDGKTRKISFLEDKQVFDEDENNYEDVNMKSPTEVPLEIILPLDNDRIVVKTIVESEGPSDEFSQKRKESIKIRTDSDTISYQYNEHSILRSDSNASTSEDSDENNYESHKINIQNYYDDPQIIMNNGSFSNGDYIKNYDKQNYAENNSFTNGEYFKNNQNVGNTPNYPQNNFNNNLQDFIQNPNKTVLRINNLKSTVHKLKIKNEFPETNNINTIAISDNTLGKTSIMINGDDCYSTIKVCDEIPLYHSSVVVKDTGSPTEIKKSSSVYITGNFVNTFVNGAVKTFDDTNEKEEEAKEVEEVVLREKPVLTNLDLLKCLSDPVEAVRRNLVPHVCGKSDPPRRPKRNEAQLPQIQTLSEEDKVAKFIQESFLKLRNNPILDVDDKDVCSEHSSSTQYEIMDQGSECYTDHSNRSSITEEELNARTKFYELLADSSVVEVSESEDHHYESIKMNPDPIYEEIEIPPPLPSNPPPSSLLDDLQLDKEYTTRSIFEGASKYDILSYLVDAKERGIVPEDSYTYNFNNTDVVIEEEAKDSNDLPYNRVSHLSTVSDSSEDSSLVLSCSLTDNETNKTQRTIEVERNDSGVGSETSKSSLSKYRVKNDVISTTCEDCESVLENQVENEPLICRKCLKKRTERKEIITEIVETEEKYSRDLQIILEEFYQPMLVAGLLTSDQLSAIFLNVEELLENSQALAERLRDAVEIAIEQGDEDLQTVNIGKHILEASPMLHAFETYCVRQGPASLLLASLEKEKELLRIFLRVSQMENTVLRRMNLNSFLMVPVQRVTKYPLLLARLYKVTPAHHDTREQLKEAQHKIELHLNHMNSETKDVPSKLWRRISSIPGRRSSSEMDLVNIKLRKIAVDVLEWNHDEAKFALEGRLLFTQPTDNNWRKGRTIKLTPVNALLVTNGKSTSSTRTDPADESLVFSRQAGVRDAALLLVRDKNGRYSLLREPLYLDRCVIAADPAWQSYFEVQELLGKDTFIFKAEDEDQTKIWYRQLQYYAQGMGAWRKRRNALANIMINGMGLRS